MKKANKILLLLSLLLCLIGGVIFGIGSWAGGVDALHELRGNRTQSYDQDKTPLDTFTKIDANLNYADLTIRPSDDDKAYLEYHIDGPSNIKPLTATVKDDTLHLADWYSDEGYGYIHYNVLDLLDQLLADDQRIPMQEARAILYLPQSALADCSIDSDTGNLDIDGLTADTLSLKLGAGDLALANCIFADSDISVEIGDLTAEGLTLSGENTISTETGSITLGLANPDALTIDATSEIGEIDLSDRYTSGALRETYDGSRFTQKPQNATGQLTLNAEIDNISLK